MTRLTILLIDDSETDRATYRRFLSDTGQEYLFVEFEQGEAALAWCEHQFPDLILLDYRLPDLDGLAFLAALQVQTGKSEFPLILLTGYGNIEIAVEAMKRGAQDYLDKGRCQAIELQTHVQGVLERWQLKQSLAWEKERQRLVATAALRIRQSLSLSNILYTTVEEVRSLLNSDRVVLYQLFSDWSGAVVVESVGPGWVSILGEVIYDPCIENHWTEPYQQGHFTCHHNIPAEGLADCYSELMARFQVQANLVIPISQEGQLWGLLIVHQCRSPRQWQEAEIDFLQELAVQLSIAISQAELQEKLQQELISRQQTEALIRQQAKFLELAYDAVIACDVSGKIIFWNRGAERLYGWTKAQIADQVIHTLLQTQFPISYEATHTALLEQGVWEGELIHTLRDGRQIIVESRHALLQEQGRPVAFLEINRDITPRKQAEMNLQESEARLRLAQEASKSGVWDWDISTKTVFWSPEYYQLYQLDATTLPTYESWMQSIYADDRDRVNQHTLQALEEITPGLRVEFRVNLVDGLHWFAAIGRVFCNELGVPIRMIGITLDITQQKQAEIALQELNAELEQRVADRTSALTTANHLLQIALAEQQQAKREVEDLYNAAPCGYHSLDAEGTVVQMNDTELSWIGYSRDEVLNRMKFTEFLTLEGQRMFRQNFPQFLQQGWVNNLEFQLCHKEGTTRWVSITATAITDSAGHFVMSRSSVFDITERKQTEKVLQQRSRLEQLRWTMTQAIRESLDLSAILNTAVQQIHQTLQVDRAAVYRFQSDWSGDFIAESVNDDWMKLVNSNVHKVWEDIYLQETQGGRFRNHEIFVVSDIHKSDLKSCHIELLKQFQAQAYAVAPIFSGDVLWGLLAIYQNINPRDWQAWEIELLQQIATQLAIAIQQSHLYNQLQVELKERERTTAVIEESERRWRSLLDNVQLIVVGLDHLGRVNYINPFFLNLTGYSELEVLGQNWFETCLPASHRDTLQAVFSEVLTTNFQVHYQNPILTKAGEERLINWNNTQLKDLQGNVIGTISIGEDITKRHQVERMKSEFLSIVSHELRTPLTSIGGALELLSTGLLPFGSDRGQQSIKIAANETERLTRLVNDILDLERLESGKVQIEVQPWNLADLMRQSGEFMQLMADHHQITLAVTPLDISVMVDGDRILQVLTNLLNNAIKFSDSHSTIWLTAQVFPASETTDPYVCLTVQDQGRGVPADKLEMIFDRFQQVDASDSRQKGGTGLGLAICQNIIQQHRGRIWAESILGQGSQFHFTLPLKSPSCY